MTELAHLQSSFAEGSNAFPIGIYPFLEIWRELTAVKMYDVKA